LKRGILYVGGVGDDGDDGDDCNDGDDSSSHSPSSRSAFTGKAAVELGGDDKGEISSNDSRQGIAVGDSET
jgi:hypothetical protein